MEPYQIQMLTAFLAFIGGWGLSLVNDRRHKRNHVREAYLSILHELNDEKEFLDKRTKKMININDEGKIELGGLVLGISRYESLIYSGIFRQLDFDVQNLMAKVYGKCKMINRWSDRVYEIVTDRSEANSDFIYNLKNFGNAIDDQIEELKVELPKLIKLINDRMPTSVI